MSEVDKSSWDYEPEGGGGLFLKIEANSKVRVRIFTDPLFFPKTWQGETRDRWGVLVVAKVAVDGKKAHSVKAWEFGPMVKKQLAALFKNDDWGDVKDYDITIERKGSGMETSYAVVPAPKKDLDPADTALIEAFDKTPADIFLKNVGAANEDGCYDPFSDE